MAPVASTTCGVREAEGGAARQHPRAGRRPQPLLGRGHPLQRRLTVDRVLFPLQRSTRQRTIVGQHDARAGAAGGQRRAQSGRPAADHQHVAVLVALLVAVGIGQRRRHPEAGRAPDGRLEPVPVRPHEGLVVEAGRHQRRQPLRRREQVQARARPAVDRARLQPVDQLDLGGLQVGDQVRPLADLHDRVGLLAPAADEAARPVQLEAAADDAHAVGQQRRGERVALAAVVLAAVEPERQRARALDAPACGQPPGACAHGSTPGSASPIRLTARISWVTVWRTTRNH